MKALVCGCVKTEDEVRLGVGFAKDWIDAHDSSAVYFLSESQSQDAVQALHEIQKEFEKEIVTLVLPFVSFKESSEQFKNYYQQGPERSFCQVYIDPKLDRLKAEFSHLK